MRSFSFGTRTERKGPVKASEIAQALRGLADKIEQGGKQSAPPAAAPAGPGGIKGVVKYWDVKTRDNGKPMARLTLRSGDKFTCFDEKVIQAADPLMAGDEIAIVVKPWTKKDGSTEMLLAGVTRSQARHGISDDEIPF